MIRQSIGDASQSALRIDTFLLSAGMSIVLLSASAAQAQAPLLITTNMDCLPGKSSALVLKDIYRRAGIEMVIKTMPAARATVEVEAGRADGESTRIRAYGDTRPYLIRVEPAYSNLTVSAFHKKRFTTPITSTDDLMPLSVGVVRAIKSAEDLVAKIPNLQRLNSSVVLVNMLNRGRFDVAVDISDEFKRVQQTLGFTDFEEVPLVRHDLYHYVHVKHQAQVQALSRIIAEMKKTGELSLLQKVAKQTAGKSCELEEIQARDPSP